MPTGHVTSVTPQSGQTPIPWWMCLHPSTLPILPMELLSGPSESSAFPSKSSQTSPFPQLNGPLFSNNQAQTTSQILCTGCSGFIIRIPTTTVREVRTSSLGRRPESDSAPPASSHVTLDKVLRPLCP